jgi:hypothetical protein
MQASLRMTEKIQLIAKRRFDDGLVEGFVARFHSLLGKAELISAIVQISTDEGDELEIGFFTSSQITDITLSRGKVYSYSYPISSVQEIALVDQGSKWILSIAGEKKFDYNVVKPGTIDGLRQYKDDLEKYLSNFRQSSK